MCCWLLYATVCPGLSWVHLKCCSRPSCVGKQNQPKETHAPLQERDEDQEKPARVGLNLVEALPTSGSSQICATLSSRRLRSASIQASVLPERRRILISQICSIVATTAFAVVLRSSPCRSDFQVYRLVVLFLLPTIYKICVKKKGREKIWDMWWLLLSLLFFYHIY